MNLYHGDCLELMRSLPDASVDAVITDPPYGTTACKWDAVIPFAPMWEQLRRVAKPNAAIVLFASQPFTSALVMSNVKEFRYQWVWAKNLKTGPLSAKIRPMGGHEDIVVFGRKMPAYNRQCSPKTTKVSPVVAPSRSKVYVGTQGNAQKEGYTRPTDVTSPNTVLEFPVQRGLHPTQKPVDLLAYLVRTYTNPGGTVLDFTMGSGTTGVACVQEGREFIGIELDAGYFTVASERIGASVRKEG